MIFEFIYIAIILGIIIVNFLLTMFSGFLQGFLLHINLINGLCLGCIGGSVVYSNHRYFNTFYEHDIHPAICFAVGIGIMVLVIQLQKTTIGFWFFTIVMSLVWAAIPAAVTYFFTSDWIWFTVVQVIGTILNIFSHIRSRNLRLAFPEEVDQNNL